MASSNGLSFRDFTEMAPPALALLVILSLRLLCEARFAPDWDSLNATVAGGLVRPKPFAQPCIDKPTSAECAFVQANWRNTSACTKRCSANLLDLHSTAARPEVLTNTSDLSLLENCKQGSIPSYAVTVRNAADVAATLEFAKRHDIDVVIKNTGHDYSGRSSAPGSLSLWTHKLKSITLHESSVSGQIAVTFGAGVQWFEAYDFAEAHNVTVAGGFCPTVGVAGGFLQGGGHSLLSNTMGLAVDRVLEWILRTVSACQEVDLWFALRGGGGGTFGVVLEATYLASPITTIQSAFVFVGDGSDETITRDFFRKMVANGQNWADDGWGYVYVAAGVGFANPKLDATAAKASLRSILNFGQSLMDAGVPGASVQVFEFASYKEFMDYFNSILIADVGIPTAHDSLLIPKTNFATSATQEELVKALMSAWSQVPMLLVFATTPASFPGDGTSSVTPAWRNSLYHVIAATSWDHNGNATAENRKNHFRQTKNAIAALRKITPGTAYLNEVSIYADNHEEAFWGAENYARLLRIKQKYDPHHLLDCWQCGMRTFRC
ncbi:hypothetical protein BKA62DRAFT_706794 [Auriculariales sp. MPI-PUGE-AT-0066]|nr:hypothetical protein BKA62DRAFT_706794 [Auriculariales sp. MPI-PUGE-AT-0066]